MEGAQSVTFSSILPPTNSTSRISVWLKNYKFAAKKIDVLSRVCFPFCFFIFSCCYWVYFLNKEQVKKK